MKLKSLAAGFNPRKIPIKQIASALTISSLTEFVQVHSPQDVIQRFWSSITSLLLFQSFLSMQVMLSKQLAILVLCREWRDLWLKIFSSGKCKSNIQMKMLFKNSKGYTSVKTWSLNSDNNLQGDLLTKGHKMCFFSILTREVVLEPDQGHKLPSLWGIRVTVPLEDHSSKKMLC